MLSREEILDHLADTFRRYGYEGATMTRIAKATGLGKASLYHYFPQGKAQMAAAVIGSVTEWFDANIFKSLESVHPPRSRIVGMLDMLSGYYQAGNLACLPGLLALTAEREMFAQPIAQFFSRWVASLAQTLTDSGLARDIAQRRANDAVERIQGALILGRASGDGRAFASMAIELPDQLLAGADRSTVWTTRQPRLPGVSSPAFAPPRRTVTA
ncbi:MAG TPA: TetR/AcrR family transcriptional regulator [Rhodospirillaceae bacterium]|nr:TetR/AcrR family transcriptional regulator [Rhodospirillaceae bacterium]